MGRLKTLPLRTDEAGGLTSWPGRLKTDGRQRNSQVYPDFHIRPSFAVTTGALGCAHAHELAGSSSSGKLPVPRE